MDQSHFTISGQASANLEKELKPKLHLSFRSRGAEHATKTRGVEIVYRGGKIGMVEYIEYFPTKFQATLLTE